MLEIEWKLKCDEKIENIFCQCHLFSISSFPRSLNCLCVCVSARVAVMWREKIILTWWFADSMYWCFSSNALSLSLPCLFFAFLRQSMKKASECEKREAMEEGGKCRVASDTYIWIMISFSANNKKTTDHDWAPCINFRSIQAINNLPHLCFAIAHTTMYVSQSPFICIRQWIGKRVCVCVYFNESSILPEKLLLVPKLLLSLVYRILLPIRPSDRASTNYSYVCVTYLPLSLLKQMLLYSIWFR